MRIELAKVILLCLLVSSSGLMHAKITSEKTPLAACHFSPSGQKLETQNIKQTTPQSTNTNDKINSKNVSERCPLEDPNSPSLMLKSNHQKKETAPEQTQVKESGNIAVLEVEPKIESVERKLEEERLKVLFLDVNSVVESVGYTMDWTANYLDSFFAKNDSGKNKAKTWGHFVLGWEPKEGEVFTDGSFPIKFKVKAKLPNLENKVEFILSDGEDDDFKTLPYESVKTEAFKLSQSSLGAAVRFLHTKSDNLSTSVRIGWGEDQLYSRASAIYRQKYLDSRVIVNLQPAIEYYVVDGWGARFLLDTGLKINKTSEVRYNLSLRDLESFNSSEWRSGLFQITALTDKSALITGISSFGYIEPKVEPISHKFSVRYRFNALRRWLFFEIEPFVELNKDDPYSDDYDPLSYDFVRNTGISFRIETHYGFL